MEFKFYKGDLTQKPLKTINEDWLESRRRRNEKLKIIFDTMPFYYAWYGSATSIYGIICKDDEMVLSEVKNTKGYKVEIINNRTVVKPDKRYKVGKLFDAKLNQCRQILQESPDFSKFSLNQLGIYIITPDATSLYRSVAGCFGDYYLAKIPVPNEHSRDKFPDIPECLTEIKGSEFLALQGK